MPPHKVPAGVMKKTARKDTKKKSRGECDRIAALNRARSPLLRLPAELRSRIYDYALVEERDIVLTAQTREPPLLHASRQIRAETVKMYYLSNKFSMDILNCDARLFSAFAQRVGEFERSGDDVFISVTTRAGAHWPNLLAWCRRVHEVKVWPMSPYGGVHGNVYDVIAAATTMAHQMRELPWETCLRVLDTMRVVAGSADLEWMDDLEM